MKGPRSAKLPAKNRRKDGPLFLCIYIKYITISFNGESDPQASENFGCGDLLWKIEGDLTYRRRPSSNGVGVDCDGDAGMDGAWTKGTRNSPSPKVERP